MFADRDLVVPNILAFYHTNVKLCGELRADEKVPVKLT
jgi:hypothetical protein